MSKIMEDVVGEVIGKEVSGVIGMVVSRINYEINLAWGFRKELEGLKEQFTRLSWLLEGASGEPITNPLMGDWLKKIKDVANDANNLIDEWSFDVLEKQVINSSGRKRDKFKTTVTYPFSRFRTSHKVVKLRKLISSFYNDANELGIKPIKVAAGDTYSGVKQTLEIQKQQRNLMYQRQYVDHELIGRDEDRKKLVKLICDPANNNASLSVVGIVGLAGLGKTALSKQVSKATEVSAYFNSLVIWVVVSHNFDLIVCLKQMVEILFTEASNLTVKEALISKLQLKLKRKKYLLVLDDVWDTTFWEPLRMTLNEIGGANGSTILVTSRDRSVIENMRTYSYGGEDKRAPGKKALHIHQMQGLNECESWSLFMARFNCDDDDEVARSEDEILLARKMVKSCKGVPLAIKALGDLLKDRSSEEWKKIEESEEWKKEDKHGILPSLRLSYSYLPNTALKKCFAYCGIFKEDEVIVKDKLICMWMAHGLLQPSDDEIMERTGEKYCKVLLNRSLFQEAKMDEYENVKTFKMHDLVTSLARVVSMGECLHSNGEYDGSSEVVVQHLSLPHFKRELTESCCMKLQTLVHEDKLDVRALRQLKKCKRLRVLRIGGFLNEDSMLEFLLRSSSFKHLRYLQVDESVMENISSVVFLNEDSMLEFLLGSSIFKHLRYLQVDDNENISAGWFERMRKLQNLWTKLYHLQTLWIGYNKNESGSTFIKVLLMSDLVSLRHIHCGDHIGIPEGLGRLTTLQTLSRINLSKKWGGRISELGSLKNLRGTLKLYLVSEITSEEDASSLFSAGDNCHIENLHLHWGVSDVSLTLHEDERVQQERVLEAMQPHSNLKRLKMVWYDCSVFPTWLTKAGSPLCNLVSLTLRRCTAKGYLQMENFSCLRILDIQQCYELRLSFPKHGFHCCKLLEQLKIISCTKVCQLPDLSPLTKLRVLHHYESSEAEDHELVGLGNLACLRELRTDNLLPADLDDHSPLCNSLQKLTLRCPRSDFHAEHLPMQLQHLKTLQYLKIHFYNVETLPEWLGNLTGLRLLKFAFLTNLKWLPSQQAMQRLSNLHTFSIRECPSLEKDIRSKSGEWLKIAHIPNTRIFEQHISPASSHYDSDTNDASSHYDSDTNSDTNDASPHYDSDTNDASPHYDSDTNSDTNDDGEHHSDSCIF